MRSGRLDRIVETLQRRRDRWGPSYVVADELIRRTLEPVVEKLTGR